MTAVIGKDEILFLQLSGKGKGGKFLSYAGVNRTVELTQREQLKEFFLHLADAERVLKDLMIDRFRVRIHNIVLVITGIAGLPL